MKTKKKCLFILVITIGSFLLLNCSSDDDRTPTLDSKSPSDPKEESNQAPESFGLISIPNGANEVDVKPEFLWNAATDPDGDSVSYELFIDTNTNPTTSIASDIEGTSFTLEDRLPLNENLFWIIIATDSQGNSTSSDTFSFTTRNLSASSTAVTANAPFSKRRDHSSVVFDDKIWVIGGYDGASTLNDIWQSTDGETWTQVTSEAPFHKRRGHITVVFDDNLWVIGGFTGTDFLRDVWKSSDGENWTKITGASPFPPTGLHTAVVFDNKLWVIGSRNRPAKNSNNIWLSSDGETWNPVNTVVPFPERYGHSTTVFNDAIWITGGSISESQIENIWKSVDGITWVAESTQELIIDHTSVVFDTQIWILGGRDSKLNTNRVLHSKDGKTWNNDITDIPFMERSGHTTVIFQDKIWVIGGLGGTTNLVYLNDVWSLD